MPGRKTLLSAGSILMLVGAAAPAAADLQARSQKAAQANTPAARNPSDEAADPLSRPIALALVDAPLGSALEAIARRAGFTLAYNADILPAGRTVTLHASALPARDAFARVLEGTGLEPNMIRSGYITLAPQHDPPLGRRQTAAAKPQQAEVTGTVTDAETGEPLRGADVRVEESDLSAVTDAEGRYALEDVPPGTQTLVATMIGYGQARREATVAHGTTVSVNFALEVSAVPLDEVVVTGTMAPTQLRAVPSPVSVLTADDIALLGATRFQDILRSLPGVGVVSYDDEPRLSYLYVRGATSLTQGKNTIKTYIDGVEVAQPRYALNQIDPASIERIEVIRGPQASTLYGSEAIAGVLQIFTKKGHVGQQSPRIQATILGGHLESDYARGFTPIQNHSIAVTGGKANVSFNAGASYRYTGEWVEDQLIDQLGWSPDNSARQYLDLSAGLRYSFGQVTAEASTRVHRNSGGLPRSQVLTHNARNGRWNYPNATKPTGTESALDAQTYGLSLKYEPTRWWRHSLAAGYDRTFIDYRQPQPLETTPADTFLSYQARDWERHTVAYRTAITTSLGKHVSSTFQAGFDRSSFGQQNVVVDEAIQLTGGLGNQNADVTLSEVVNHGFFVQAQTAWQDQLFLTAGLRADRSTGFGVDHGYKWSPRVGLAHVIDLGSVSLKARGSYGSAIRPPEPDQQYGRTDANVTIVANDQLAPETQAGYDLGLELYVGSSLSFSVTRYNQRADDLVTLVYLTDFSAEPRIAQYQNVGRIKNAGWEFEGIASLAGFTVRANYSVLESTVEALSPTYTGTDYVVGQRPLWTPRSTGNASITRAGSRATITIAMRYKGPWNEYRYIDYLDALLGTDPNREPYTGNMRDYIYDYPSIRRWSVNASYRIGRSVTARLTVDNILNDGRPTRRDLDLVKGRQIMIGMNVDATLL